MFPSLIVVITWVIVAEVLYDALLEYSWPIVEGHQYHWCLFVVLASIGRKERLRRVSGPRNGRHVELGLLERSLQLVFHFCRYGIEVSDCPQGGSV